MKNSFLSKKKIWIAGHDGMVGSAILRNLKKKIRNTYCFKKKIRFKNTK